MSGSAFGDVAERPSNCMARARAPSLGKERSMRGCLFRMLAVSGLMLAALSGCSSPLRLPPGYRV
jgi:hypothetical protein